MTAEKKVKRKLSKVNEPLKIEGQGDVEKKPSENSYFSVYDLEFSEPTAKERKAAEVKANKDKTTVDQEEIEKLTLTISGNEFAIALQASLLDAFRDLLRYELKKIGLAGNSGRGGSLPYMKGQPLISLEFVEDPDKVGINSFGHLIPPVTGTITFRIMDKTDDPKSALDKISKSDLRNYAERISREFGSNGRYVWEKGKAVLSYRNRNQGFEGWYFVKNKGHGIALVRKLLAITGQKIDITRIKFSETENAEVAYPETPGNITVLGEKVELARERPVVDVRFRGASIHLPRTRKTIQLVLFANSVYK